jgi:hypothetical protein
MNGFSALLSCANLADAYGSYLLLKAAIVISADNAEARSLLGRSQ